MTGWLKFEMSEKSQYFEFESCYAAWTGDALVVGNELIERKWRVTNELLHAVALRDKQARFEWIAHPARSPAPSPLSTDVDTPYNFTISSQSGKTSCVEESSLIINLAARCQKRSINYYFQIFPQTPTVRIQVSTSAADPLASAPAATDSEESTGVEQTNSSTIEREFHDCLENFILAPLHFRLLGFELKDQTDIHDELVFEREWLPQYSEWDILLKGNLFIIEDTLHQCGLIFLKHAPLPHARPIQDEIDFAFSGRARQCALIGHGISPEGGEGYPFATITYSGGRSGRIKAIQQYQRRLRPFVSGRDVQFLSNTWGDRSRDARINEEFVIREIEAGARLGVDVVQIDDGWQRGVTANSTHSETAGVWNGFWDADPRFWDPHPTRFPNGLDGIVGLAKQHGTRLGLWFAPDSSNDFSNWQLDAGKILEIHRGSDVCYFKIDGVKAHTRLGEQNLHRFFNKVLTETEGRVVFDLDVTAEIRPGYFGIVNSGPIFVENRYTDWHNYWPHQTLRNLWKLAQYVDPARLRFEFLNNDRNANLYGNDPFSPSRYRPDYLFATVMFSNPLGWFETSNLPVSYFDEVAPLVMIWKQHREAIFCGIIVPIGAVPDGTTWTGLVSTNESGAYLLIFRELNGNDRWATELPMLESFSFKTTVLAGEGTVEFKRARLTVHIPHPQRFVFASLEKLP